MAKNFFKTFFNPNKDKNNNSKTSKLNPTYKLSELMKNSINNNDDSKILHQQQQTLDSFNILLNYYSNKDAKNSIVNNFIEKISKLNKKFYMSSEKFIRTKTTFDKLSDELYLNLFKQIDCYVEEIQRLNKKLTATDINESKIEIKKLTKELNENKQKVRNYEVKLKEKSMIEEKLIKELESYKRRIIFFKNKININLMIRNTKRRAFVKKYNQDNNYMNNSMTSKNVTFLSHPRGYINMSKNRKGKFFSPSPEKNYNHNRNESLRSSTRTINFLSHVKDQTSKKNLVFNHNIMNNTISNFNKKTNNNIDTINTSNNNLVNVNNKNKYKEIFSDGEIDNSNKMLIKINRKNNLKESIIVPLNKNYNKDDDTIDNNSSLNPIKNIANNFGDINNSNINININKKEIELTPKKSLKENINSYSPGIKIIDNFFEKLTESNSIFSDNEEISKRAKNETNIDKKIKKFVKINPISCSTLDIKSKLKTEKKKKINIDISTKRISNLKNKSFKTNTNKKRIPTKKIFTLPSKKLFKSNLKKNSNKNNNNTLNSNKNINNTINNNNNILENIKNKKLEDVKKKEGENNNKTNIKKTLNTNSNILENINDKLDNNRILENINNNNNINNIVNKNENINKTTKVEDQLRFRIMKSKTVKFKDNASEKEHNIHFETSGSENNDNIDISSKDISVNSFSNKRNDYNHKIFDKIGNKTYSNYSGNISDTLSKGTNNENLSNEDNSMKLKNKNKQISKKNIIKDKKKKNINLKEKIYNPKKNFKKDKTKNNNEKEITKILKEMNDDYNNELEMLKTQEEQIKLMLNLIDLNEI